MGEQSWNYSNANSTQQTAKTNQDVATTDFRKDIILELYNEAGQRVLAYNILRCWVSEFHALTELDGTGNTVVIQALQLENEGWERDDSAGESVEPSQPGSGK